MSVFGIVVAAVKAVVPLPFTYPVRDVAPVPPYGTVIVDAFHVPAVNVPTPVIPV